MELAERDTGIDVIGSVPWGTHFCLFYKTGEDLSNILVPFFDAGVRNNEFCMCIASNPVNADEMKKLIKANMPNFDDLVSKGQIEIIPYSEWYLIDGVFDLTRVLEGWNDKLLQARERGFIGARVTGNTFWLDQPVWNDFMEYERAIDGAVDGRNFIALCTYSLDRCGAKEIIDVVSSHQFALTKYDSEWKVIENSELKETRQALQDSEARYRSLFDNMLNGFAYCMMLYDNNDDPLDFVYLNVNGAFGRLTGLDNVVGKKVTEVLPGIREIHPDLFELYGRVARTGRPEKFEIEFKPLRAWLSISVYSTERGYFTAIFEDITERKLAEDKLKTAKAQAELYLDLMGHDINNMHHISLGYLELALDLQTDGAERELLDKSIEVLHRSTRLIQNVRKLQKIQNNVIQIELIDVVKVLLDVQREYGAVPNKSVILNLNECDHCRVYANELLHDIFANLVTNAIKHTGDRTAISINLERVEEKGRCYCRVSVEDNGPGIPDDDKITIFNRTLMGTSKAKGMGIGLYLVKSLVDSYDGRIWVEDRVPGDHTKGARFVVILSG